MRNSLLLFVALAAMLLVNLSTASPFQAHQSTTVVHTPETVYRLPTNVIPVHYNCSLVPRFLFGEHWFDGKVSINVSVEVATNVIILHADELDIDNHETRVIAASDGTLVQFAFWHYDPLRQFYIISFTANLPVGYYTVALTYTGQFSKDMYGLYTSSYMERGQTRRLVTTQFQPTGARRAFPCFDEPGLKATFDIRIAHFTNQIATSNTHRLETSDPDINVGNRVWTSFETTPLMSTYLLVFTVSEFIKIANANGDFGIYARPEQIQNAEWALHATELLLPALQTEVGSLDPSPKIEQIAIPDFSAGAMENWGLFTYRERLLLWKDGYSSSRNQEEIVSAISHELAHIWFGNLVSPVWWDHLWFNEGFASFYQWSIPSLVFPQWRFAERIVTDQQLPALIGDSLETTRPMTNIVGDRHSALSSFDNIAYSKGAAVFRMLNLLCRADLFSKSLENYFAEAAFETFEPESLWRHLQNVSDQNNVFHNHTSIATIMDTWTTQPGYPLITVTRNYSTSVAMFSQERFFMNPKSPTADAETPRWWVPITSATGNTILSSQSCNPTWIRPNWLRAQDKSTLIAGVDNDTWVLANCQGIGFFRTNYDTRNWELLTEFLHSSRFTLINAVNRGILIDDSLNLARAGYIDYSIPLNLISYLRQETDFVVWRAAIPGINYLNTILGSNAHFGAWKGFLGSLVNNVYHSLSPAPGAPDNHQVRVHREQIFNLACQLDVPGARASAEARFDLWIADPLANAVNPDLKSVVYCWGARVASEASWNIMWDRFVNTDLATEVDALLRGLACAESNTITKRYLELTITPGSGIRSQDAFTVFTTILNRGPQNVYIALEFLRDYSQQIVNSYDGISVDSILSSISDHITTASQLEMLRSFVNSSDLGASVLAIQRSIQTANANLEWISNRAPVIENWLEEQGFVTD